MRTNTRQLFNKTDTRPATRSDKGRISVFACSVNISTFQQVPFPVRNLETFSTKENIDISFWNPAYDHLVAIENWASIAFTINIPIWKENQQEKMILRKNFILLCFKIKFYSFLDFLNRFFNIFPFISLSVKKPGPDLV